MNIQMERERERGRGRGRENEQNLCGPGALYNVPS